MTNSGDETPLTGEQSAREGQNALRVKVAELRGYQLYSDSNYAFAVWHSPKGEVIERLPNWPNDLNACAELIKHLEGEGWTVKMRNWLHRKSTTWTCEFRKGLWVEENESEELAEAICRAFVALHEGMK